MVVGVFFDLYRIVRWQLGLNRFLTFIGDLLFSCAAAIIIFYFAQRANYLELRFYIFFGSLLGLLIYLRFLSFGIKKIILRVIKMIVFFKNILLGGLSMFFNAVWRILNSIMSIPYGILRWFAMLVFRIGEALWRELEGGVKAKILKYPKE